MRMIICATLALGGCASSVEGIKQEPILATYTSSKAPLEVATCLKEAMPGLDIQPRQNEVSVSNRNQFGSILMNWLIKEAPSGSVIELRRTNAIAPGMRKAEGCY